MEEKSTGEPIPISTQKSLASSHDAGWNDPPKWAYSQSPNLSTTPTKRVLNKRVAFPLGSTPPTSNFDPYQSLPPPPANMPPPPLTSVKLTTAPHQPFGTPSSGSIEKSSNDPIIKIDKDQALIDSLENFEAVINANEELKNKADDIRRRLNPMKTAWTEDKLNESIQQRILELSNALRNKDVPTADKIHVSLMVDHATLCSPWIPVIRHIIMASREQRLQQANPTADETVCPYLLPTEPSSTLTE
ncbi:steroid receptor RNA activator 1-like [Athalia rosae]|uniref:steroid receptor RNA activator 1-like n=1 Tax=Athalia rosae TaxID=37344 RepID=UPI0020346967|nr:steroid receptor RNA activator 1-like [Athalia rosae]